MHKHCGFGNLFYIISYRQKFKEIRKRAKNHDCSNNGKEKIVKNNKRIPNGSGGSREKVIEKKNKRVLNASGDNMSVKEKNVKKNKKVAKDSAIGAVKKKVGKKGKKK